MKKCVHRLWCDPCVYKTQLSKLSLNGNIYTLFIANTSTENFRLHALYNSQVCFLFFLYKLARTEMKVLLSVLLKLILWLTKW